MVTASDPRLIPTRRALHGVAELVLAGPQHAQTGEISLRSVPGGFATTHTPDLRVVGTDVVGGHHDGRHQRPHPGHARLGPRRRGHLAVRGLLRRLGLRVPTTPLEVDADAAAQVADAFAAGDAALRALAPDETPILWPEHFDIGITVDEVNYGVSAGDTYLAVPYAYVGPWSPPAQDDFWNAPFGRAVPVEDIADLLAFFTEGRDRLRAG